MKKFEGKILVIPSANVISCLEKQSNLITKILCLVTKVYDEEHAQTFLQEMKQDDETIIVCMVLNDEVVGVGCICESHISFGVYELFWGMIDENYRGNGWGKILVNERIKYVMENKHGKSEPTDIIVVTTKPWHLERCGFEVLKQLNNKGELLMYRKLNEK
jgi:ribosomal protein S18 acetylase RimI-like enzyme